MGGRDEDDPHSWFLDERATRGRRRRPSETPIGLLIFSIAVVEIPRRRHGVFLFHNTISRFPSADDSVGRGDRRRGRLKSTAPCLPDSTPGYRSRWWSPPRTQKEVDIAASLARRRDHHHHHPFHVSHSVSLPLLLLHHLHSNRDDIVCRTT